ncbi:MAG: hypothetical protein ACFFE8_09075 [Candidatus Heimdallarchaeota archaeon]
MNSRSKKPLFIPITATVLIAIVSTMLFFSAQNIQVEIPPQPTVKPNLSREGSSFSGYIDVVIPVNVSNQSPATLQNIRIEATLSIVSIETFGLFPDTTILNVSHRIKQIDPYEYYQLNININVSSWIVILAIMDAYLVIDIEIFLDYHWATISYPFHWAGRVQGAWEAPFVL